MTGGSQAARGMGLAGAAESAIPRPVPPDFRSDIHFPLGNHITT